jgi:hypothetical protein
VDLARCIPIIRDRLDTLELLCSPLSGSKADGTSRSGISDPTPAQALALMRYHDLQGEIQATLADIKAGPIRLWELLHRVPSDIDTASLVARHRCTGGEPSTESWVRPECTNLAVTRDGLCDACRQRRDRWQRTTRTLLDSGFDPGTTIGAA